MMMIMMMMMVMMMMMMMMMMLSKFCGMVHLQIADSQISRKGHFQEASPT